MNNIGYLTDCFFLEDAKEITIYPNYTVVKSPNEPNYYFGNYLLLNQTAGNFDKQKVEKIFKQHFTDKGIKHFTFRWSGEVNEDLSPFIQAGYELELTAVLAAKQIDLIPLKEKNEAVNMRPFKSKADWQQWIDLECEEKPDGFAEKGFRNFIESRASLFQHLNHRGCGNFYGAYINQALVASAGLFYKEGIGGFGRFQSVRTKTSFRKRGICKTLIDHICKTGFQELDQLVIAAEKDYHALNIYKGFGFKQADFQTSVFWNGED